MSETSAVRILVEANNSKAYINLATATILAFDYFLTLNLERELIWKRSWSLITILFLITRYSPFLDTAAAMTHYMVYFPSEYVCLFTYQIQAVSYLIGLCASEYLLLTRTVAVWGNERRVFLVLVILWILTAVFSVFFEEKYIAVGSSAGTSIRIEGIVFNIQCPAVVPATVLYLGAPWILILCFDTVLVCLILPKALLHRDLGKTDLYDAVYVNGFRFYLYTFATSVANIVILLYPFPPGAHKVDLMPLDRVLHAILAERLILSIRGAAVTKPLPQLTVSDVEFHVSRAGHHGSPGTDEANDSILLSNLQSETAGNSDSPL